MLKVFQLIFSPGTTWQAIAATKPSGFRLLAGTFLPLGILAAAVEYYGLTRWETPMGDLGIAERIRPDLALRYCAMQGITALVVLAVGSKVIHWLCEGFHFKAAFSQCFMLAVYGLSPFFLGRMLDAAPAIHTWVCWGLGAAGCVYVLYQGTGLILEPDLTKGFGLYLLSTLVLIGLTGLGHFVALSVLDGKIWK